MTQQQATTATEPNTYHLQGGHLHVTYGTTSITGKPFFRYDDGHQALDFHDTDIRVTQTELGRLVTVSIIKTVDTGFTGFTLIVPEVRLPQGSTNVPIRTVGITTRHTGPNSVLPLPQREQSTAVELSGTASLLMF
jgi:hypothetical protein